MERHQSRNILLVEDEPLIALKEQRLLERAGYSVKTAHSGEQAVEKCSQASGWGEPDLVLMDIDLGEGIDGVEAAGRILERRDLPVVFLTSHTEREYVDRVKQVSRYGYVLKSSGELMLLESIAMAFELFEAHQATKRQKAQYERLFSSSEEAIAVYDLQGRVQVMNPTAAANLGGVPEDYIGRSIFDFLPEENARRGLDTILAVAETGRTVRRESPVRIKGETRWFDTRYYPVWDDAGTVSSAFQISGEITQRKHAEEALRRSEAQYRLMAENTVDVIYALDAQLAPTYISPSASTLFGYSAEDFRERSIFEIVVQEDAARVRDNVGRTIQARGAFGVNEFRILTAAGKLKWVENRARYLYEESGALSAIVGTIRDITDRKRAEEELQKLSQRHAEAERTAGLGHWEMEIATGASIWSDEFFRICGYEPQSFEPTADIGFRLIHPDDQERAGRAINKAIETGTPYDFEKRIVRPDGEVRWVHSRGEVVHNEQGEPVKLVGSFLDITERKQAQRDLQHALDQKNQLMRELNHRVKNNLHMVSSLISLKDAALGDAVDLSDIMSQVDTIAFIYEKLQRSDHAGLVDFATYARDLVTSIFNQRFVGGIQIDIRIGDLQLPAKTATTLGLIINELATNAAKYGFAAEGAQRFTVSMETEHHDDAYTLTVSNTGHRFPDHVEPERAESLGLQLVYGLTAELDGAIELHRDPETTFTIRFPAPGRGAADAFSTDAGREGVIGA